MNILALQPYYGGSHKAFLDGWAAHSRHEWTILGLPPNKWKWRMRHAAVTLADACRTRLSEGARWDVLVCSDMLNLAEFKGLVGAPIGQMPGLVYFHENQLTYPCQVESERDLHFGVTNFTTALAADEVWFNSEFHRTEFLEALPQLLSLMPDNQMLDRVDVIRSRSHVRHPGIETLPRRGSRRPGPPHILWVARWEHDKQPRLFFDALEVLREQGIEFRLNVLGQRFSQSPAVFDTARKRLAGHIDHWGYLESREEYTQTLLDSDIVVSTADHEFFGIAVVEAIAAGDWRVLPNRLAYPEILSTDRVKEPGRFFYEGTQESLVKTLQELLPLVESGQLWGTDGERLSGAMQEFQWESLSPRYDAELEQLAKRKTGQTN